MIPAKMFLLTIFIFEMKTITIIKRNNNIITLNPSECKEKNTKKNIGPIFVKRLELLEFYYFLSVTISILVFILLYKYLYSFLHDTVNLIVKERLKIQKLIIITSALLKVIM